MRFLDVAGSGALSLPAARIGARVLAIDISPNMLARLETRARAEGLAIETRVMDGHARKLEAGTFDVCGSQFGIMLFPDVPRALEELVRVVKPGGRVLMNVYGSPDKVEFIRFFVAAIQAAVPGFAGIPSDPPPLPFQLQDPPANRLRWFRLRTGVAQIKPVYRIRVYLFDLWPRWLEQRVAHETHETCDTILRRERPTVAVGGVVFELHGHQARLKHLEPLERGEPAGLDVEAPKFVAAKKQRGGNMSDIVSAKALFRRVPQTEFAGANRKFLGGDRRADEIRPVIDLLLEPREGDTGLLRSDAHARALTREKDELLERVDNLQPMKPGNRHALFAAAPTQ